MYAKVIIDTNSRFLNKSFIYEIPKKLNNKIDKGMRVIVPFGKGNKSTIAFIYELTNEKPDFEVKEILDVFDFKKMVSDELIDLAFFMSKRYISPIQSSIKQVLPPGKIKEIKEFYFKKNSYDDELVYYLSKRRSKEEILKKFPEAKNKILDLINKKVIGIDYDIKTNHSTKYKEIVSLDLNFDKSKIKNAKKQESIVNELLVENDREVKELLSKSKASRSSLNSLIDKKIITIQKIEELRKIIKKTESYKKFVLTNDQNEVYKKVVKDPNGIYLLKGVTGSGKTEVFLQLVEKTLEEGKEAIILVPEISLTPQTIERFTGRFGKEIAVIHSGLSLSERFDQWRLINNGDVKIVIGARSAIFAPFKNLGIIIIDEEHDQSYISSKDPKYHTKEVAEFRQKYHKATLILASATPSIDSMVKVNQKKYNLLELKERINKSYPDISIVDMRDELKASNYSMISRKLYEEIRSCLDKKEQVILFLNKIGHNSFTFCRSCGYVIKCDACDVSMTYHKKIGKLVCHYCGRTKNQPKICPNCGSKKIKEFGAGTEKLEEEVRSIFKDARIMRMDSQTTGKKDSYEKMYKAMKDGKVDILIGTQMIAKGLDFKNVTLVGIVAADLSLNFDDYTAQETSFQLLTQVSGRAGRDKKSGKVVIQTYRPDNFVIQAASKDDYSSFYKKELEIRKAYSYPPYTNLLTIKIVNIDRTKVIKIAHEFKNNLVEIIEDFKDVEVIGPNPCKIGRINNKYRYNIIVKVKDDKLKDVIEAINATRNTFIHKYQDVSFIAALNPSNIN